MPATATFIVQDDATKGDWLGVYGMDGYYVSSVCSFPPSPPAYVSGYGEGNTTIYGYGPIGSQPKFYQVPSDPTGLRETAVWYNASGVSMYFNFSVPTKKRLALYLYDIDAVGRSCRVDVLDQSGLGVLDSRSFATYVEGHWLVWDVSGDVRVLLVDTSAINVVASIFAFSSVFKPAWALGSNIIMQPGTF